MASRAPLQLWIALIALAGMGLRVAAGREGLWLDEAWSAVLPHHVGTPLGVFVQINHDNNHHLNSLWLQLVGLDAPPLLARALSIVSGSVAAFVAGIIAARRAAAAGLITAWLFALSPLLVTLGSEARGYAPMVLMVLIAIWYIDRFLAGDGTADRPITIAICFFVGALFQLTMIFAACALIGWPAWVLWQRHGARRALVMLAKLLGPAVLALLAALAIVFLPAAVAEAEFRLGAVQPFTAASFMRGISEMFGYVLGMPAAPSAALAALAILVVGRRSSSRPAFTWLAIVAFPIAIALVQMVNAAQARYYLLAGLALLLLLGELLGRLMSAGGWRRASGAAVLLIFSIGSMAANLVLIRKGRGDPAGAIAAMARRSPDGASLIIQRESSEALLRVAAVRSDYPLRMSTACHDARFLFAMRFRNEPDLTGTVRRCDAVYRVIAAAKGSGLSAQNWTLYERVR